MAVALVAALLVGFIGLPGVPAFHNWGFGAGWTRSYAGQGEPVCIKSPARGAAH
jgi:hypothetical protein